MVFLPLASGACIRRKTIFTPVKFWTINWAVENHSKGRAMLYRLYKLAKDGHLFGMPDFVEAADGHGGH